jgi:hypothetical protein
VDKFAVLLNCTDVAWVLIGARARAGTRYKHRIGASWNGCWQPVRFRGSCADNSIAYEPLLAAVW